MKYLWLISQNINNNYDTYDSAVVVAETAEEAKEIYPSAEFPYTWRGNGWYRKDYNDEWVEEWSSSWTTPDNVSVQQIGIAYHDTDPVIVASFNAG